MDKISSVLLSMLIMAISFLLVFTLISKMVDKSFPKQDRFTVGQCFSDIDKDKEPWDNDKSTVYRVKQIGKRAYLVDALYFYSDRGPLVNRNQTQFFSFTSDSSIVECPSELKQPILNQ